MAKKQKLLDPLKDYEFIEEDGLGGANPSISVLCQFIDDDIKNKKKYLREHEDEVWQEFCEYHECYNFDGEDEIEYDGEYAYTIRKCTECDQSSRLTWKKIKEN